MSWTPPLRARVASRHSSPKRSEAYPWYMESNLPLLLLRLATEPNAAISQLWVPEVRLP